MDDSAFVANTLLAKANELGKLCETTLQLTDSEVATGAYWAEARSPPSGK